MQQPFQLQWVWGLLLLKLCVGSWTAQSLSKHLFGKLELHSPRFPFLWNCWGEILFSLFSCGRGEQLPDVMRGRGLGLLCNVLEFGESPLKTVMYEMGFEALALPCGWSVVTGSSSWHCARPVLGMCQAYNMLSLNSHKMHFFFTSFFTLSPQSSATASISWFGY